MKQKELEKLVEEFVEKVKENETIQESDLGEFLVDKEICEMSEIERNYILRSAQAITYKDRYDKSSTSTNKYITQKCIDTVIGEHKLSGRYEKTMSVWTRKTYQGRNILSSKIYKRLIYIQ
jgi:hypothetical protein